MLPVTDHYDGDRFFTTVPVDAAGNILSADGSATATSSSSTTTTTPSSSSSAANSSGVTNSSSASGNGAGAAGVAVRRVATPLLLTLAVIELSDVVFAVDSIPAVFGVTLDPLIVYSSNMFAIMSLRSLYTFVSTVMTELRFLDRSVAIVLGFIGAKMVAEFAGWEVPTDVSLLVVGVVLGGGVAASLLLPEDSKVE